MALKVVIVGGGAAGMSAAASVRRESPEAVITLYEKGDWISYAMCGLPYFIGGVTDDPYDLVTYTPEAFWEKRRVQVKTRHEVIAIDPGAKEVTVKGPDGTTFQQPYDRLILATGATSKARHHVRGVPGAFGLHTMDDALAIRKYMEDHRPQRALVVGSGYIGLEMADELRKLDLDVTLWKGRSRFLGFDSPEIDAWIEETMQQHGVKVVKGRRFQRVEAVSAASSGASSTGTRAPSEATGGSLSGTSSPSTGASASSTGTSTAAPAGPAGPGEVALDSREERQLWKGRHTLAVFAQLESEEASQEVVETELLILAIGSDPVSPPPLTKGQLETGPNGALMVDRYLRTNIPDIWAVGDGVVAPHRFGPPTYLALATTANRMGRIAGYNAVHTEAPIEFAGITGTIFTTAFGLDIARTGFTDDAARRAGYEPVSVTIKAPDRSAYFPDAKRLILRLSADLKTGRLLGAELAGPAGSGKRIDAVSVALYIGLTAAEVKQLDLAYVPPRSTVWDPLLIAGHELEKKLAAQRATSLQQGDRSAG